MSRQDLSGSRDRLVDGALRLISRQGYEATVVKEIARESGAPMGSFYYHFPGGKEELAAAAMRRGGDDVKVKFAAALAAHERPGDALAACALLLADGLEDTEWQDGCPVATTALETIGRSPRLQAAAAETFAAWQELFAEHLRGSGLAADQADELALTALSLIEGAEMISRVRGSREALERAADALRVLVGAAGRG
ncbi:TetR/AcrR family transcriptional regulator [Pseudonocardia sp. TRM90224]|uniref:TetR/AcrR family transcriptional regulator n=1 Tax=Pseudonocardia sp. TRM90224 TaxID=2812678 RepID=UPI001E5CBD8F|nr:TetR/AcrR family transcriptional regulator [Pseudonocardia sp. TRM90224]